MKQSEVLPAQIWLDSHCHLDSLEASPEQAVSSAQAAGVGEIINVGTDLVSSAASVDLAAGFPSVWATVGIHPHEAKHADENALGTIRQLAAAPRVVALGEIGLDFYRDHSPRDVQVEVFRRQLTIAGELSKPVVLHIREAHSEAFHVLREVRHSAGLIFHCFSAGVAEVERALEMGGYISFAGNISFKKSESIQAAAARVPMDRLLVETDAPYLAPTPHRGKPNGPSLLPQVGKALAEAKDCTSEQIAEATRSNAHRIFGLQAAFPPAN